MSSTECGAVQEMEVGPPKPLYRKRFQTTVRCSGKEPGCLSITAKARGTPRCVRFKKMNVSEPPMTCRNDKDGIKTEVGLLLQEEPGRYLVTAQAVSGIEVA